MNRQATTDIALSIHTETAYVFFLKVWLFFIDDVKIANHEGPDQSNLGLHGRQ